MPPLNGIRVVEFGNLVAAPYATMMLADLGAEVIKVEPPEGELGRHFGPRIGGESAFFLAHNRGKRSVTVDLASQRGKAIELAAGADVVVSNLRHGVLERHGLDHPSISQINRRVIYAVISAFGADGPYADRAGIDIIFQAESGMVSITGEEDGPPGKTATTIGDYLAGTNAALAVCAALVERERTGVGRQVEIGLRDGLIAAQGGWNALAFASGEQPRRTGTASPFLAPNQVFETADGLLALAIVSDRHFRVLAEAVQRPDLAERYPTNPERMAHHAELVETLTEVFRTRPARHWVDLLTETGLPVGRVLTLPEVWEDPQVIHNRMVLELDHPGGGSFRTIGSPLRTDGRPLVSQLGPPRLGQH